MTTLRCISCGWVGDESELRQSWPVSSVTVDEPFGGCPVCGCDEFDEVEDDRDV